MSSPASDFNNMYDEFMKKLKKIVKTDPRLWTLHDAFITAKKANSRMPVEFWINTVHPFSNKIFERDESFFLKNKEIKEVVNTDAGDFNTLESLSGIWNTDLNQNTKEAIWSYLENLCILSYVYLGIDVSFDEDILKKVLGTSDYFNSKEFKESSENKTIVEVLKEKFA